MEAYRQANLDQERQKMLQDAEQFVTLKRIQEMILNEQQAQSTMQRQVTASQLEVQAINKERATRRTWDD